MFFSRAEDVVCDFFFVCVSSVCVVVVFCKKVKKRREEKNDDATPLRQFIPPFWLYVERIGTASYNGKRCRSVSAAPIGGP